MNGSDRETLDEAFPGDVVGLVNANDVRVGDTLWFGEPVTFPRIPSFAPEYFSVARVRDTGRFKQFRKGMEQLKKLQKDGDFGEDEVQAAEKELDKVTQGYVAQIDDLVSRKEEELMEV